MIQSFRPTVMKQKVSHSSFVKTTDPLCTDFSVIFIRVQKNQQQAFRCTSLAQNMYLLYKLLERTVLKVRVKGDTFGQEREPPWHPANMSRIILKRKLFITKQN